MGMYGVEEELWVGEYHFFRWICQHAKSILADPEYQRLKQRDQASDVACHNGVVDPGMREVIAAWNAVPGVVVSSSWEASQRNHHVCRENTVGALCARRRCNHRYRVRGRGARLGDGGWLVDFSPDLPDAVFSTRRILPPTIASALSDVKLQRPIQCTGSTRRGSRVSGKVRVQWLR